MSTEQHNAQVMQWIDSLMTKLNIDKPLQELVDNYNIKLNSPEPLCLNLILSYLDKRDDAKSESQSDNPRSAPAYATPWHDILVCMYLNPGRVSVSKQVCPHCGERGLSLYYVSPPRTWQMLHGRAGYMDICPNCMRQIKFILTFMN